MTGNVCFKVLKVCPDVCFEVHSDNAQWPSFAAKFWRLLWQGSQLNVYCSVIVSIQNELQNKFQNVVINIPNLQTNILLFLQSIFLHVWLLLHCFKLLMCSLMQHYAWHPWADFNPLPKVLLHPPPPGALWFVPSENSILHGFAPYLKFFHPKWKSTLDL